MSSEKFAELLLQFDDADRSFRDARLSAYILFSTDPKAEHSIKLQMAISLEGMHWEMLPRFSSTGLTGKKQHITIMLAAGDRRAVDRFASLATMAGGLLSSSTKEILGCDKKAKLAAIWLTYLLHKAIEIDADFLRREPESLHSYRYDTLESLFFASMYIIRNEGFAQPVTTTEEPQAIHSEDFTSVKWYGKDYQFNPTQARCIRLLWKEWERGGLGLNENTIGEAINTCSDRYRLAHTFRVTGGKMHPAWKTMIHAEGNSIFRLRAPNHQ